MEICWRTNGSFSAVFDDLYSLQIPYLFVFFLVVNESQLLSIWLLIYTQRDGNLFNSIPWPIYYSFVACVNWSPICFVLLFVLYYCQDSILHHYLNIKCHFSFSPLYPAFVICNSVSASLNVMMSLVSWLDHEGPHVPRPLNVRT